MVLASVCIPDIILLVAVGPGLALYDWLHAHGHHVGGVVPCLLCEHALPGREQAQPEVAENQKDNMENRLLGIIYHQNLIRCRELVLH